MELDDPYNLETRSKCKKDYYQLNEKHHINLITVRQQKEEEINCLYNLFSFFICFYFCLLFVYNTFSLQSSEDLDTDTEFEPVEDMTLETRSRCNIYICLFFVI